MDKVSIVIPFYNCPYIDRAIRSALSQSYENIEVIVVNDGSELYSEKITSFRKDFVYIEKENGGTASALNAGIREATGDFFTWLSSDDLYHPEKVKQQMKFMKDTGAKASYMPYLLINEKDQITSGQIGEEVILSRYDFIKRLSRACFINGCTVMLDMNLFTELGLFDESLLYTQDYDFWLRVSLDHNFHFMKDPLVYYRLHENMGSKKHIQEQRREIDSVRRKYYRLMRKKLMDMSGGI